MQQTVGRSSRASSDESGAAALETIADPAPVVRLVEACRRHRRRHPRPADRRATPCPTTPSKASMPPRRRRRVAGRRRSPAAIGCSAQAATSARSTAPSMVGIAKPSPSCWTSSTRWSAAFGGCLCQPSPLLRARRSAPASPWRWRRTSASPGDGPPSSPATSPSAPRPTVARRTTSPAPSDHTPRSPRSCSTGASAATSSSPPASSRRSSTTGRALDAADGAGGPGRRRVAGRAGRHPDTDRRRHDPRPRPPPRRRSTSLQRPVGHRRLPAGHLGLRRA